MLKSGMAVKELIQELRQPPSNRIVAFRIEFADGSVYHLSPFCSSDRNRKRQRPFEPAALVAG
jgi:hypothetical protein